MVSRTRWSVSLKNGKTNERGENFAISFGRRDFCTALRTAVAQKQTISLHTVKVFLFHIIKRHKIKITTTVVNVTRFCFTAPPGMLFPFRTFSQGCSHFMRMKTYPLSVDCLTASAETVALHT